MCYGLCDCKVDLKTWFVAKIVPRAYLECMRSQIFI